MTNVTNTKVTGFCGCTRHLLEIEQKHSAGGQHFETGMACVKESCWDSKGWREGPFMTFVEFYSSQDLCWLPWCCSHTAKLWWQSGYHLETWDLGVDMRKGRWKLAAFVAHPWLVSCCYSKNTQAWKSWARWYRHVRLAPGRQRWKDQVSKSSGANWSLTTQIKWT